MSVDEANRIARATQRLKVLPRSAKIALPTAAALGAGAAIAVGSIPDGNGKITGCYVTQTDIAGPNSGSAPGTLRVIDPSLPSPLPGSANPNYFAVCGTNESTITWNQHGPAGPVGPQGPQGPAGGQGAQGVQGAPLLGGTTFGISGNSSKVYLKIEDIQGASTDKGHTGDITIQSFSFGSLAAPSAATGAGGAGAGKVKFAEFSITKVVDKSSPILFQKLATGKHYAKVTLSMRKAGGGQTDFLKFDFQNVIISSYKVIGTAGGTGSPQESVGFEFTKVTETFEKANKVLGKLTFSPNTYTLSAR
jgi:type VI secretion system secreted protein Hcp